MLKPFHLAILECDTPVDAVKAEYGTYGDIFKKFLLAGWQHAGCDAASTKGRPLTFSTWDVVDGSEYPDVAEIDGLLITGSRMFNPRIV